MIHLIESDTMESEYTRFTATVTSDSHRRSSYKRRFHFYRCVEYALYVHIVRPLLYSTFEDSCCLILPILTANCLKKEPINFHTNSIYFIEGISSFLPPHEW
jgi:hypothetical protein